MQVKTGLREEEEGRGRREGFSSHPGSRRPAHLPEVNEADDNPNEWQPQPVEVDDALGHPLHIHRHQVDHVPNCTGLSGTAGQSQDLGRVRVTGRTRRVGGGRRGGRPDAHPAGLGLSLAAPAG